MPGSAEEVLGGWTQLFTGPVLLTRYLSDARAAVTAAELQKVEDLASEYRARLDDLFWFMRTLNEHMARARPRRRQGHPYDRSSPRGI